MAVETELKLRLTPTAARRLLSHPLLSATPPQRTKLLNTYYDTPELELLQRRLALRLRRKGWDWLLTVKGAAPAQGGLARRSEWEAPTQPGQFHFDHVDDKELRRWLEKRVPRLEPAFTTDFIRLTWELSPVPGTRVEVALDRGWIASRGQKESLTELELELLAGDEAQLFVLAQALGQAESLHPVAASKAERGYILFTGRESAPVKARPLALEEDITPRQAFRRIALNCLEQLQANERGARLGQDSEYVHQARVAIRRLRSALKLFAPALPAPFLDHWEEPWRALGAQLGDARNWDVLLGETLPPLLATFPEDPDVAHFRTLARARQQRCQQALQRLLASPAYSRLLLDFASALFTLGEAERPGRWGEFAHHQLQRQAGKVAQLEAKQQKGDHATRHRLRIACKKLRYTSEFLAPDGRLGASSKGSKPDYLTALTGLQEVLGQLNDLATARALVDALVPDSRAALLRGWLAGKSDALLDQLPPALARYHKAPPPWGQSPAPKRKTPATGRG